VWGCANAAFLRLIHGTRRRHRPAIAALRSATGSGQCHHGS
jgi:hypothetical protein